MFTLRPALTALLWLLVGLNPGAWGYRFYAERIPNGENVPHPCKPNYLWHGVGHENALGGGTRNAFGLDFKAQGAEWTETLCRKDSDGDGLTNGQELGDPDCVWTLNATHATLANIRTTNITHPGVCDPWDNDRCREINTWVSCDLESFQCDALENDPGVRNVTLRFPPTPVPNTETNYFCMTFDLPDDATYHMVANEPVIDNADVMHHIVVYGCEGENVPTLSEPTNCGMEAARDGCRSMIAIWTVGLAGTCNNPNTGFIFGRGEFTRIKMEFHWNNPELRDDYRDSSGMRFFFTPNLRPYSSATLSVGQIFLEIPPRQEAVDISGTCSSECTSTIITQPLYVTAGWNHMHYLGRKQRVELIRNNQVVALLTDDQVYSYDSPVNHIHDPPIQVMPGDEIRTTCQFTSKYRDTVTYYGEATSDEMCFAFLTVYPREAFTSSTTCVGYKEWGGCRVQQDCNFDSFLNASIPIVGEFIQNVSIHCKPFAPCTPECAQTMLFMANDPCMRGSSLQVIKRFMSDNHQSMYFLSMLMSCWPTVPCTQCSCGHDIATDYHHSGNDDDDDQSPPTRPEQPQNQGGAACDPATFLNSSSTQQFLQEVGSLCPPFGSCTPQCQQVMATMANEPCLQGNGFLQLKQAMMVDLKSMQMMSRLMACQPSVPCPTCRQCPEEDATGNAPALVPGLLGLVTVLVAALPLFN